MASSAREARLSDADAPEFPYVLPVVPEDLGIDPLFVALLHCAAFLDLADDEVMDPEAAGDALEHVGLYVQRLPPARLKEVEAQLAKLAAHAKSAGWPPDAVSFVEEFLYSCGIGDDKGDEGT